MSRWADAFAALYEGADKTDTNDKTPLARGAEADCVNYVHCVTPPNAAAGRLGLAEPISPRHNRRDSPKPNALDDLNERAALIEYGADVPRAWAEGYAALSTMAPPAGFSSARWQRIVDAAGRFMDRWAREAIRCGWDVLDIFGVDAAAPSTRFDKMGVLLLVNDCEIVGLDEHGADLLFATGSRLRFRRRPFPIDTVRLWDLAGAHEDAI